MSMPIDKIKVMTLVGTRPELIKLSRVIAELDSATNHVLVHSGQNHAPELASDLFTDLGIRSPDHFLDAARSSAVETIAEVLVRFDLILARERPDAVVIYGDTDTALGALSAKRRRIPIFHMEAGNRCFDDVVPEEINRRLIDHFSDVNMVLSEHARRNLLAEGIASDRIIKVGSPMVEVLAFYRDKIAGSSVLSRLDLKRRKYFVASFHRAENVDDADNLQMIAYGLAAVQDHFGLPVIISTHPRTRRRLQDISAAASIDKLRFLPPFSFTDFVHLQMNSACVISDSGSLTEEASILDLPAVALRKQHERLEGMDVGTVVMAGIAPSRLLQAIELVLSQVRQDGRSTPAVPDYINTNFSRQVSRIVLSYTDYVRRVVWKGDTSRSSQPLFSRPDDQQ